MIGRSRWISSMKRMSPARRFVSVPTRSPGFSSAGPEVVRMLTRSSRAMSSARVVLPSPGGPKKSAWSSGSLRASAASMARRRFSLTFCWPMNSSSRCGRSESSTTLSSARTSGVVISARDIGLNYLGRRIRVTEYSPKRHRVGSSEFWVLGGSVPSGVFSHPPPTTHPTTHSTSALTVTSRSAARFSVSYFLQNAKRIE